MEPQGAMVGENPTAQEVFERLSKGLPLPHGVAPIGHVGPTAQEIEDARVGKYDKPQPGVEEGRITTGAIKKAPEGAFRDMLTLKEEVNQLRKEIAELKEMLKQLF